MQEIACCIVIILGVKITRSCFRFMAGGIIALVNTIYKIQMNKLKVSKLKAIWIKGKNQKKNQNNFKSFKWDKINAPPFEMYKEFAVLVERFSRIEIMDIIKVSTRLHVKRIHWKKEEKDEIKRKQSTWIALRSVYFPWANRIRKRERWIIQSWLRTWMKIFPRWFEFEHSYKWEYSILFSSLDIRLPNNKLQNAN